MRITFLIVSIIVLLGCQKAPKAVAPAVTYDAASVETRKIEVTVDASGVVEPESTVEVKSKASGEVLKVNGETGDIVTAGTLLVQIDKRTPANNVSQSESALKAATALLRLTRVSKSTCATPRPRSSTGSSFIGCRIAGAA